MTDKKDSGMAFSKSKGGSSKTEMFNAILSQKDLQIEWRK